MRNTTPNVAEYVMQDVAIQSITRPAILSVVFACGDLSREWMCFLSA